MPAISVITIIFRYGYIDTIVESLKTQTFKDFELILVDELYEQRKDVVKEYIGSSFPLKHIPPRASSKFSMAAHAHNDAIMNAEGELLYYLSDYVYAHPDSLKCHWEIYKKYGPKVIISGPLIYYYPFKTDARRDIYIGINYSGQIVKLRGNSHDPLSVLDGEFEPEWPSFLMPDDRIRNACSIPIEFNLWECPGHYLLNPSYHKYHWWAGVNDSAPLEALLEVNGFNENLDGEHGGHIDGDISARFMAGGYRYLIDTSVPCLVLPKASFREKGEKIEGKNVPMHTYSLREKRKEIRGNEQIVDKT